MMAELARAGSYVGAYGWSAGLSIGLPPVMVFGDERIKQKVKQEKKKGEERSRERRRGRRWRKGGRLWRGRGNRRR